MSDVLPDDCAASRHFLDATTLHSLAPWLAANRTFSLEQATAHFRKINGSHLLAPVLAHNGSLYLHFPLHPDVHVLPFQRMIHDLRIFAERYPELSFEIILGMHDDPQSNWGSVRGDALPVWGFNRNRFGGDILIPHHYVRPDQLCHDHAVDRSPPTSINASLFHVPWAARERRLMGRFSHYCSGNREVLINGNKVEHCPRSFFPLLAQKQKHVAGVVLDVAPTGNSTAADGAPLLGGGYVPLAEFARARYVLVTDGQVGAGKFAHALALGSVVLRPTSVWTQFFEPALVPYVHFVPVWTNSEDDILGAIAALEREPLLAARIAAEGRRFSCHNLALHGRNCWWREAVRRYNALVTYRVTDALLEERKRQFPMVKVTPELIRCNLPLGVPFANICQYEGEPPGWEHSRPREAAAAAAGATAAAGTGA